VPARQLMQLTPRLPARRPLYLQTRSDGARWSTVDAPGGIRVGGAHRLSNDFERKTDLSKLFGNAGKAATDNAELAVLACCDGTKARRMQLFFPHAERTLAVLLARKPAWLDGWISYQIDKPWVPGNWWPIVRGLVRAGIASKPVPATYVNLMVNGIAWKNWRPLPYDRLSPSNLMRGKPPLAGPFPSAGSAAMRDNWAAMRDLRA
jgi:hypothetical protein